MSLEYEPHCQTRWILRWPRETAKQSTFPQTAPSTVQGNMVAQGRAPVIGKGMESGSHNSKHATIDYATISQGSIVGELLVAGRAAAAYAYVEEC